MIIGIFFIPGFELDIIFIKYIISQVTDFAFSFWNGLNEWRPFEIIFHLIYKQNGHSATVWDLSPISIPKFTNSTI